MASTGKARTVAALAARKPFKRSGYGMWAMEGVSATTGRMDPDAAREYTEDRSNVAYTVLSYATPIAWVLADGTVKVPDVSYSRTTTQHQTMCRVHL